mgnify:CR=1 FL=1
MIPKACSGYPGRFDPYGPLFPVQHPLDRALFPAPGIGAKTRNHGRFSGNNRRIFHEDAVGIALVGIQLDQPDPPPEQRIATRAPMKHRFPKGFHRGLELFGQHGSRLKEPGYREQIARCKSSTLYRACVAIQPAKPPV